jgi:hypothetical protein
MSVIQAKNRQQIVDALRTEVDQAAEEYSHAKERLWKTWAEVPHGDSRPHKTSRAEVAERAQLAAMAAYENALRRFNRFLLAGIIPEDLKEASIAED